MVAGRSEDSPLDRDDRGEHPSDRRSPFHEYDLHAQRKWRCALESVLHKKGLQRVAQHGVLGAEKWLKLSNPDRHALRAAAVARATADGFDDIPPLLEENDRKDFLEYTSEERKNNAELFDLLCNYPGVLTSSTLKIFEAVAKESLGAFTREQFDMKRDGHALLIKLMISWSSKAKQTAIDTEIARIITMALIDKDSAPTFTDTDAHEDVVEKLEKLAYLWTRSRTATPADYQRVLFGLLKRVPKLEANLNIAEMQLEHASKVYAPDDLILHVRPIVEAKLRSKYSLLPVAFSAEGLDSMRATQAQLHAAFAARQPASRRPPGGPSPPAGSFGSAAPRATDQRLPGSECDHCDAIACSNAKGKPITGCAFLGKGKIKTGLTKGQMTYADARPLEKRPRFRRVSRQTCAFSHHYRAEAHRLHGAGAHRVRCHHSAAIRTITGRHHEARASSC